MAKAITLIFAATIASVYAYNAQAQAYSYAGHLQQNSVIVYVKDDKRDQRGNGNRNQGGGGGRPDIRAIQRPSPPQQYQRPSVPQYQQQQQQYQQQRSQAVPSYQQQIRQAPVNVTPNSNSFQNQLRAAPVNPTVSSRPQYQAQQGLPHAASNGQHYNAMQNQLRAAPVNPTVAPPPSYSHQQQRYQQQQQQYRQYQQQQQGYQNQRSYQSYSNSDDYQVYQDETYPQQYQEPMEESQESLEYRANNFRLNDTPEQRQLQQQQFINQPQYPVYQGPTTHYNGTANYSDDRYETPSQPKDVYTLEDLQKTASYMLSTVVRANVCNISYSDDLLKLTRHIIQDPGIHFSPADISEIKDYSVKKQIAMGDYFCDIIASRIFILEKSTRQTLAANKIAFE